MGEIDISERLLAYRECLRIIWNNFYLPMVEEAWDAFSLAEEALFEGLILRDLPSQARINQRGGYTKLIVKLAKDNDGSGGVLYCPTTDAKTRNWHSVPDDFVLNSRLCFVELFDYLVTENRDFRFVRALVIAEADEGARIGGGVLVPTHRATVSVVAD
jgi:hypothetical protein